MATDGFVGTPDGVRIAYRDHGGFGRGLVLLHGIGGNLETMDQYAARLGSRRRTVAIDLRCCGQSGDGDVTLQTMAGDVDAVARALNLGELDVVGHSLGGMVASAYGESHPRSRIVSIDGFPPGRLVVARRRDRIGYRQWLVTARDQLHAMTLSPDRGDTLWRPAELSRVRDLLRSIGYTAPNAGAVAERHFVYRGVGTFQRHPARHVVDALFREASFDVLRHYRATRAATLLIRCTGWAPPCLDVDLADLTQRTSNVEVVPLAGSHLSPAWDAVDEVVDLVCEFWGRTPRPDPARVAGGTNLQVSFTEPSGGGAMVTCLGDVHREDPPAMAGRERSGAAWGAHPCRGQPPPALSLGGGAPEPSVAGNAVSDTAV